MRTANAAITMSVAALLLASASIGQGMTTGANLGTATAVGDVTGDGRADWATHTIGIGAVWLVHDAANGAVIPHLTRPWAFSDRYVEVGDIDGDGCDDVCHAPSGGATIVSGANGATLLSLPNTWVYGGADIDGDGLDDLLLRSFTTSTSDVWIRSSRTGAALFSKVYSHGLDFYSWAVFGDENGDGYDDAALLHEQYFMPGLLRLTDVVRGPNGSLASIGVLAGLPCGDVDGDGAADIGVSVGGGAPSAYILGGGSHTPIWNLPTTLYVRGVGDLDGDGRDDVAGIDGTWAVYSGATHLPLAGSAPASWPVVLCGVDADGRIECVDGATIYEWVDPALPVSSRMLRRGTPGTTSSGRRPKIVTRGHCGLGHPVWFDLRGNEPNSPVVFALGDAIDADLAPFGAPGNRCYTTLAGLSVLVADPNGVAVLPVVMPTSSALLGAAVSLQSATFDPAANPFGLVTSNAIDLVTWN